MADAVMALHTKLIQHQHDLQANKSKLFRSSFDFLRFKWVQGMPEKLVKWELFGR